MTERTTTRALRAAPIMVFAALMLLALSFAEPVGPPIMRMRQAGLFSLNGVETPLRASFYRVPVLDDMLAHTTVAFAQLQLYPADPKAYWQSLVFLAEYGGLYAVLLMEACRGGNRRTLFRFPFLVVFLGQFIPIGLVSPIYFFSLYISSPQDRFPSPSSAVMDASRAAAVLPTVALAYHVPNFSSYFHPSYEARHWWNWVWQLYPVWKSLIFFISTKALGPLVASRPSQTIVSSTVGILAATSTATYWCALSATEFSLPNFFIPEYLVAAPQEPDVALRTVIQYDYICTFGGALLWLAYSLEDLKAANSLKISWFGILGLSIIVSSLCGIGTMLLLGWAWRQKLQESGRMASAMKSR